MGDRNISLIVVDPGHFHAALVQREMFDGLSPLVRVHAPLEAELLDYLDRIARFNTRAAAPTAWQVDLYAAPYSASRLREEKAGGVVVLSGRNQAKIDLIEVAIDAGLHVLCDKPAIIRREQFARFEAVLAAAAAKKLAVADMMSGRVGIMPRLIRSLTNDADLFGGFQTGTVTEPAVVLGGVHHLLKTVSGVVNRRWPWYFDIGQQGEGLADTGVHLVDRVHEILFPGFALDYRRDVEVIAASRWPTEITSAQFEQVSGVPAWPAELQPWVEGDRLRYFCNGQVDYRVRGIHARLETVWGWQAAPGRDDTQAALFRGAYCDIELRHGAEEHYRPELYIVPRRALDAEIGQWAQRTALDLPGLDLQRCGQDWRVIVPDALRIGHEAQFAAFARQFFEYARRPESLPARDRPNLLAKYHVTTKAVALSHRAADK